jgi:hypothetical protein
MQWMLSEQFKSTCTTCLFWLLSQSGLRANPLFSLSDYNEDRSKIDGGLREFWLGECLASVGSKRRTDEDAVLHKADSLSLSIHTVKSTNFQLINVLRAVKIICRSTWCNSRICAAALRWGVMQDSPGSRNDGVVVWRCWYESALSRLFELFV